MRILLVDDNRDSLQSLQVVLSDLGHQPEVATNAQEALNLAAQSFYPLIITDIRMPGMNGLELLGVLKSTPEGRNADVVIITGHGDMQTAVEALRKGAYDYLNKPINARELAAVVERCCEHQALLLENMEWRTRFEHRVDEATQDIKRNLAEAADRLRQAAGVGSVVAASPAMIRLVAEARIYHKDPSVSVLIEGETGTGKEVLARLVHYGEGMPAAPFLAINCSAIPGHLFESELFGHDAGAFTGSTRQGLRGKLEIAEDGALFLDEVAEMPLELQPKLLRVLEERTFYRVGGVKKRHLRARVICAANRDMSSMVENGRFRRDLYYRLNVVTLAVPESFAAPKTNENVPVSLGV